MIWLLLACEGNKAEDTGTGGLEREELGAVTTDTAGEATVEFELRPSTVSALVWCGPYGYDVEASVRSLTDPAGAQVYSGESPYEGDYRFPVMDDFLVMLLPVTPGLLSDRGGEGLWSSRIRVGTGGEKTVSCGLIRRPDAPGATADVGVEFVFVGVDEDFVGLNATGASVNASFQQLTGELESKLGLAGLTMDPVLYTDFSGDLATYQQISDRDLVGALLRTSTGNRRQLTIFVVNGLQIGGTQRNTWGSMPGALALSGTSRSGIVVSTEQLAADPVGLGRELARDSLAFMGLFYPTEPDGSGHDPLSDTPVCTDDNNDDGQLSASECTGAGAENLLWWSQPGEELSAEQAEVTRQSPGSR